MRLQDTTKPLAHIANTDAAGHWEARSAELDALIVALVEEGLSPADAAWAAFNDLDRLLDCAQAWDAAAQGQRSNAPALVA